MITINLFNNTKFIELSFKMSISGWILKERDELNTAIFENLLGNFEIYDLEVSEADILWKLDFQL